MKKIIDWLEKETVFNREAVTYTMKKGIKDLCPVIDCEYKNGVYYAVVRDWTMPALSRRGGLTPMSYQHIKTDCWIRCNTPSSMLTVVQEVQRLAFDTII